MEKTNIVIIGGGIAGLTAAYYLRTDPRCVVTILEASDRIGGRLLTDFSGGETSEMGGLITFDWYSYTRKIVRELGLDKTLTRFTNTREVFWNGGLGRFEYHGKVPLRKLATQAIFHRPTIFKYLRKSSLYEPDLDAFGSRSVAQLIEDVCGVNSPLLGITEQVTHGYCYGSIDELPASLYIGFLGRFIMYGGFGNGSVFSGGIKTFTDAVALELERSGTVIRKDTGPVRVDSRRLTFGSETLDADVVIRADGIRGITETEAYSTRYYSISGTLKEPFRDEWMAAYIPWKKNEPQPTLVSIGQARDISRSKNERQFIACLKQGSRDKKQYHDKEIVGAFQKELKRYFPAVELDRILAVKFWDNTMPVVTETFVKGIRQLQGNNATYYVGDYFSAPCIETAIYSAYRVASMIRKSL